MNNTHKEKEQAQQRNSRSGFTLVEILVVVAIIGMLAAVAVNNVIANLHKARIAATRASINAIYQASKIYSMDHNGKFPNGLEDLTKAEGDKEPYLEGDKITDAWGTEFQFQKSGKKIKIISAAADLEFGTEDDITN
jgi:general secretion pathway protein G